MTHKHADLRKGTLASLAVLLLASSVGAYGTFAFFNDTEVSTSNIFSAGTLDLELGGAADVDAFLSATNFAPGDTLTGSLTLSNVGTISTYDGQGHTVDLTMDTALTAVDAQGASTDMAEYLELTTLTYDGASLMAQVKDLNDNGRIDMTDLAATTISGLDDPGVAGKVLELGVVFHTSAGNALQGDSVTSAFTFLLEQS